MRSEDLIYISSSRKYIYYIGVYCLFKSRYCPNVFDGIKEVNNTMGRAFMEFLKQTLTLCSHPGNSV